MRCPPGSRSCSAAASQGSYSPATGLWTVGALESACAGDADAGGERHQPGALVNNASMASQDQIDPNPINNSDAMSVNAAAAADLRVIKAVSDAAPGVGALVTYTIAVTNLVSQRRHECRRQRRAARGIAFVVGECITGQLRRGYGRLDAGRRAGNSNRDIEGDGARHRTRALTSTRRRACRAHRSIQTRRTTPEPRR